MVMLPKLCFTEPRLPPFFIVRPISAWFALKGFAEQGIVSANQKSEDLAPKGSSILMQEKATAEQMNEAVANPNKSIVEAKA